MAGTPNDLLRFLANADSSQGVPLSQLPESLLDVGLLLFTSGGEDNLVEFSTKVRWIWRSGTDRNYASIRDSLPELLASGTRIRLTGKGQVEAARLAKPVAKAINDQGCSDATDEFVTYAVLAARLGIPEDDAKGNATLCQRLDEWRSSNPQGGWVEHANAKGTESRYLYPLRMVWRIVDDVKHPG